VLADSTRETADAKRRELQALVGKIELEVRPGKRLGISVSAGTSVFPHDGATQEALLADADQRMYRDKAARRGDVVAALAVAPIGLLPPNNLENLFDRDTDAAAAVR
jgi:predicted signal transduction protein with EAL and GGDEF domain